MPPQPNDLSPVYLVGPTASGKSAVALEVARQLGCEIVNADAYQIYAGLEILTAQPSQEDLATVPHHLYGMLPSSTESNAGFYARTAVAKLEELQAADIRPLVVGGSGLYVKALTHGLNDLPQADAGLRAELDRLPIEELSRRLLELDPESAESVNLLNPRHVQRALEICLLTGEPASQLKSAWAAQGLGVCGVFLNPERVLLYDRINSRTPLMFSAGAAEEVARITEWSATASRAIGVREIQALLSGQMDEPTVIESIRQATRNYAKRQVTWFRKESCFLQARTAAEACEMLLAMAS